MNAAARLLLVDPGDKDVRKALGEESGYLPTWPSPPCRRSAHNRPPSPLGPNGSNWGAGAPEDTTAPSAIHIRGIPEQCEVHTSAHE